MSPEKVLVSSMKFSKKRSEEMRQLFTMGGSHGRINKLHEDWVFDELEATKINGFTNMKQVHEDINVIRQFMNCNENDNKQSINANDPQGTYQLIANSQLQEIQEHMCCATCSQKKIKYEKMHAVESLMQIMKDHPGKSHDDLLSMWKDKENEAIVSDKKSKMKLHYCHRGLSTEMIATCEECSTQYSIKPKLSSLSGSDWNQQPTGRWNNSWYDLNVRAVLATLAIGGGGSDLSDFLSLIDIPNCANFGSNSFHKIES